MRSAVVLMIAIFANAGCGKAPEPTTLRANPKLSSNAPQDQPGQIKGNTEVDEFRAAIAPYVEKGRKTYPEAKKRYLAGLPAGQHFFVVTNLRDGSGAFE